MYYVTYSILMQNFFFETYSFFAQFLQSILTLALAVNFLKAQKEKVCVDDDDDGIQSIV